MEIDFERVQQRFSDTGRSPTLWARAKGLSEPGFRNYITGRQRPARGGEAETKLIRLLAEDNLLVLKDDKAA